MLDLVVLKSFTSKTTNATSWKPRTSWLIVLRRENGMRDVRNFRGTYAEAVKRRNECLDDSLYASAWLVEEREKSRYVTKEAVK